MQGQQWYPQQQYQMQQQQQQYYMPHSKGAGKHRRPPPAWDQPKPYPPGTMFCRACGIDYNSMNITHCRNRWCKVELYPGTDPNAADAAQAQAGKGAGGNSMPAGGAGKGAGKAGTEEQTSKGKGKGKVAAGAGTKMQECSHGVSLADYHFLTRLENAQDLQEYNDDAAWPAITANEKTYTHQSKQPKSND